MKVLLFVTCPQVIVASLCPTLFSVLSEVRADCADSAYGWTATFGATGEEVTPRGIAYAPDGGIVVVGTFTGSVDFSPGDAVDLRTSLGSLDVFVTKLNNDGSFEWTRTFGGPYPNYAGAVADAPDGSVVLGGATMTGPSSNYDIHPFIAHLDADGRDSWSYTLPVNGGVAHIAVDSTGVVVLVGAHRFGYYDNCMDLDPSDGVDIHCPNEGRLFVTRYDLDGTYRWTRFFPTPSDPFGVSDIALDGNGSIIAVGNFQGSIDFDPTSAIDLHGSGDALSGFVMKLGSDGSYGWVRSWSGSTYAPAIAVTARTHKGIYVTGAFWGTVDFDPGAEEDLHSVQELPDCNGNCTDVYVTRLNLDGSYSWTRTFGGPGQEAPQDIALDSAGNPIVVGTFGTNWNPRNYTADFDPSPAVDLRTTEGFSDIFVTKLYSYGEYAWTRTYSDRAEGPQLPHPNEDTAGVSGLATSPMDGIAIVGRFGNAYFGNVHMDFDPTEGLDIRTTPAPGAFVTTLVPVSVAPTILTSDPPSGTIDVRQDRSISGRIPQGIEGVRLLFSCRVRDDRTQTVLTDHSFKLIGIDGWQGGILEVQPVEGLPNTYDVLFAEPIRAGKWTELIPRVETFDGIRMADNDADSHIVLGFLPGDIDGNRTTGPLDVLALVNSLTGAIPLPLERTDINRSDVTTPADVRRLIQLLDGINTSRPWIGESLGPPS